MNYVLTVLTSPPGDTLGRCLASFHEYVRPEPTEVWIVSDGYQADPEAVMQLQHPHPIGGIVLDPAEGFCRATETCWGLAARAERCEYAFHLEHDFVFTRPVDLRELALVLDKEPRLAQMQMIRDAVNEKEKAAGGVVESRPGEFTQRWTCRACGTSPHNRPAWCDLGCGRDYNAMYPWMEHSSYLTTNPALMRRDFMLAHPWPDYPARCEGLFGIDLVRLGFSFGAWGSGEPWVNHIGVRQGFGY